ncbi:hypothetical protein JMJ77_0009004, partial [Colletotrichum scovillei]
GLYEQSICALFIGSHCICLHHESLNWLSIFIAIESLNVSQWHTRCHWSGSMTRAEGPSGIITSRPHKSQTPKARPQST